MQFNNPKTITKLLLLIGLVTFFFPFVMVSCSGEHVEASGFELMTTISTHEEIKFDSEDAAPNLYLAIAFVCGLLAFGAAWDSHGDRSDAILGTCFFSAVGALFLFLFRFTFWEFYEMTDYKGMVDVEFRWGWILSTASYIGAAGSAIASYYWEEIISHVRPNDVQSSTVNPSPTNHMPPRPLESIPPSGSERQINATVALSGPLTSPQISNLTVHIVCRLGAETNKSWTPSSFPCVIGRNPSVAQIVINDNHVSGIHAKLSIDREAVMISDENSSNGTFVNGSKISAPTELLTGDIVVIGETELYFEVGT